MDASSCCKSRCNTSSMQGFTRLPTNQVNCPRKEGAAALQIDAAVKILYVTSCQSIRERLQIYLIIVVLLNRAVLIFFFKSSPAHNQSSVCCGLNLFEPHVYIHTYAHARVPMMHHAEAWSVLYPVMMWGFANGYMTSVTLTSISSWFENYRNFIIQITAILLLQQSSSCTLY